MQARITLPGRPVTKKNHNIVVTHGRPRVLPSRQYAKYAKRCLRLLRVYSGPRFSEPVHLVARYYMPNRRSWPDLLGLLQATCDILQAAGVIEDDKLIVSFDGSGIAGVDRRDPRTEILIEEADCT